MATLHEGLLEIISFRLGLLRILRTTLREELSVTLRNGLLVVICLCSFALYRPRLHCLFVCTVDKLVYLLAFVTSSRSTFAIIVLHPRFMFLQSLFERLNKTDVL